MLFSKGIKIVFAAAIVLVLFASGTSYAYRVPNDNSGLKYFYVFGKDGDPLMGKEDSKLELVIDVPKDHPGDVMISVFDPNVGGKLDWKKPNNEWDTRTEFAVYGASLLDKKEFGAEPEYDKAYYVFGPYPKEKGEAVGNFYRFKLVATGLSGDDENLFNVEVKPESAEAYSENITFRLLPRQGDKMYFYPHVPAGTKSIVVKNYDLDIDGGSSTISMTAISEKFPINDSESGEWRETIVPISTDTDGRLIYIITKATQRYANAGLAMATDSGKPIPIYFRKGTPPVAKAAPAPAPKLKPAPAPKPDLKCNKFTFDATSSYDIDKQKLSFLWNFGDGETSTEPIVTHIYEKGGEYTVTLTVKDDSGLPCDTAVTTQKILVNTPPVAAFSAPELVCLGDSVSFDASATKDDTPANLTYMWNFGDGTKAEGQSVTHAYAKGGTYDVALTVDDNSGTACNMDSIRKRIKVNTPPVADAGKDITMCLKSLDEEYAVTLSALASKDADGDMLTYMWDFGDGNTAQGEKVTHVYKDGGVYNVKLTVTDGTALPCSTSTSSVKVDLNKPPVAVAGSDQKVCTGEPVSFDGTSSKSEKGETLSYEWVFGDGEKATGAKVSHTYNKGGKYVAVLTVDDGRGTACSVATNAIQVDVNSRPVANLAEVKNTCVGKSVAFDASASKDPDGDSLKYMWNFGDGTKTESGSKVSHEYQKGGSYNVSVAVDDAKDSPCSTASTAVSLKVNTPPAADMKIAKACCVDMEQKFDASASSDADGDAITYSWDFGDGTQGSGPKVSHTYTKPGNYKVILTVNDGSGTDCSSGVAVDTIQVNAKPVPVIKIK